jgi:hypothetical protein
LNQLHFDDPLDQLEFTEFRMRLANSYTQQAFMLTESQKIVMKDQIDSVLQQYVDTGGVPRQWETVLIWQ